MTTLYRVITQGENGIPVKQWENEKGEKVSPPTSKPAHLIEINKLGEVETRREWKRGVLV